MTPASLRALLNGLVDYAGLFPPAKLDMTHSVETFARHRAGPMSYGIARFICPMSRLPEWAKAASPLLPSLDQVPVAAGTSAPRPVVARGAAVAAATPPYVMTEAPAFPEPWPISVLVDGALDLNLKAIDDFNHAHYRHHHYSAVVDTVEIKVATPDAIDYALEHLPEELYPFFEIPLNGDVRGFATALAGTGAGAKIRTGGIAPEMFPTSEQVADFIIAMNDAEVPFKATAGLHHPVRNVAPLTYEPNSPTCTMHGFINVFMAAVFVHELDLDRTSVLHVLNESDAKAFRFTDADASWRNTRITTAQLAEAREDFAICFGCCSYDDPINDLKKLGLL